MSPEAFNSELREWVKSVTGKAIGEVGSAARATVYRHTQGSNLLALPDLKRLVQASVPHDLEAHERTNWIRHWTAKWQEKWTVAHEERTRRSRSDGIVPGQVSEGATRAVTSGAAGERPAPFDRSNPITVITSSAEYHRKIVDLEARAQRIDYIQYRVSPFFQSNQAVEAAANLRFGHGNPLRAEYIGSQRLRREAFYRLVDRGVEIRELYPRDRLERYVRHGTHSANLWPLEPSHVVDALEAWCRAIEGNENYAVAITDQAVPIKYHVIDASVVSIHEPIGKGDAHRLCAVLLSGDDSASQFLRDFELIWSLTDGEWRDPRKVSRWIKARLIPLALGRGREVLGEDPRESK